MSLVTAPQKIFGGVLFTTTSHPVDPGGRAGWADVDIAHYVKAWGGSFSFELNDSVTYLIALPQDLDVKHSSARGKLILISSLSSFLCLLTLYLCSHFRP